MPSDPAVAQQAAVAAVTVDFGVGRGSEAFRTSGWSISEPGETWTVATEARLALPAPQRPATYVMNLRLRPMLAPPRVTSQRLLVTVNGSPVGDFTIDGRAIRTCLVPWEAIAGHRQLQIVFHLPGAARPLDLGIGKDDRLLGAAFQSLQLYPDVFEAWQPDAGLHGGEPVPVDMATSAT